MNGSKENSRDFPIVERSWSYAAAKRCFDVVMSLLGIILLGPLGIVIAALIKITDRGPVFYGQIRVGRFGRPFKIWKFRTMVVNADRMGPSVTRGEDPRITRIGRFLRKTKLDELPQLWNVLRGDMSFVGPRPEVPRYVEHYTPEQRQILQFRPGITDLATLLFRNEETLLANAADVERFYIEHCIPKKFELNREYAKRASLWSDLMIIVQTLCPYWLAVFDGYVVGLAASLWLSYQLRFDFDVPAEEMERLPQVALLVITAQMLCLIWRRELAGLMSYFGTRELKQLASGMALAACLVGLVWWASGGRWGPPRSVIVIDALLAFGAIGGARAALRSMRERRSLTRPAESPRTNGVVRVGIVGAGEMGAWLATQLNLRRNGRRVEVLFDDDPQKWNKRLHGVPIAGMPECVLDGSWSMKLDEVIVAMPEAPQERIAQVKELLSRAKIPARILPSLEEILS